MSTLDELLDRVNRLQPDAKEKLKKDTAACTRGIKWTPNPGPQTEAYFSRADCLLYGGEPGGGKSQLLLGLAFNEHERTLVMRRKYGDLDRLIEDALKIHGSRDGFNGSPPPKLKAGNKIINFAAAHKVGDERGQMGKGHDLLAIDEATHFAESQVRFLMGWIRTENPKQRCRVVFATNPPLTAEGLWVTQMFAPWIDPKYPNPAKPGELRWVVTDGEGKDRWVDGPGDYEIKDEHGNLRKVQAMSRTYIPASVKDNPYYVASGYQKQLDALPEPIRSLLLGGFRTTFKDQPNQIIPTAWVIEAQKRWAPKPPEGVPMCSVGVDCSGGGDDPMVIVTRYDGWFGVPIKIKGRDIPMDRSGAYCAGQVMSYRRGDADIVIDMGGGYGSSTYEHLVANHVSVKAYKGAEATTRRGGNGKLKFTNKRSAALWLFREALDPGQPGGSPIALPDSIELIADLTAPTFQVTPGGIKAESKEDVCDRLGRSTNEGDAVIMAFFEGPRELTHALEWADQRQRGQLPKVLMGRR